MAILNNLKKREIILISLLVIALITVSLYQTLATDITMSEGTATETDLAYTFDITDQTGRVVNVKAGVTKILDIFLTNNNSGTVKYGIAYTPSTVKTDDITIAQTFDSRDTVSGKIEIIMQCNEKNIPVISSMGTGNKLDPSRLEIADIYKTSVCPLAKVMRKELKSRGIKKLNVVYSKEEPLKPVLDENQQQQENDKRRKTPASISFVPPSAGLLIASKVIRDLAGV